MAFAKVLSPGSIDGLVRLLADDDERIRRIARENLTAAGVPALEIVRDRAQAADDPQVRRAAEEFLLEARRQEALAQWTAFASAADTDLEKGMVLIARSEHPALEDLTCSSALDEYAEVLRRRLGAPRSPAAVFERIGGLLFTELGYRGNRESYYDPQNSYLDRVIERKLGIPISLSALFILVARRLGQRIEGVGMPGHFLLRYRVGRQAVFIDAFDQGRRWTYQDCVAHLEAEGFGFREEYLKALTDREMLLRMLANLLQIYHSLEDGERSERVTRMAAALKPGGAGRSAAQGDSE